MLMTAMQAAMNEPPGKAPIMIFAGYKQDMDRFMQANEGLYRRIAYTFDFRSAGHGSSARLEANAEATEVPAPAQGGAMTASAF